MDTVSNPRLKRRRRRHASQHNITQVIDVDALDDTSNLVSTPENNVIPSQRPNLPQSTTSLTNDLEEEELLQPFVDIHQLFNEMNHKHFYGQIKRTYVEYSSRMTLCAGTCTFRGAGGCRIGLSEPLLKLRPRSDLVSTLLHEMIHAYLFETLGVAARDGPDGHGPKFMSHANRINKAEAGRVSITPYHTFTEEVDVYRQHHWRCVRCSHLIKRAMNRAPGPHDYFWAKHQHDCGGVFEKIAQPPPKKPRNSRVPKGGAVAIDASQKHMDIPENVMKTHRIDQLLAKTPKKTSTLTTVPCPVCSLQVVETEMNNHLDKCLEAGLGTQSAVPPVQRDNETPSIKINDIQTIGGKVSKNKVKDRDLGINNNVNKAEKFRNSQRKRARTNATSTYEKEREHLETLIIDVDAFADLAFNPSRFLDKTSQELFRIPTEDNKKTSYSFQTDRIFKLLAPLVEAKPSRDIHEKARKLLQTVVLEGVEDTDFCPTSTAKHLGISEDQLQTIIESNCFRDNTGRYRVPKDLTKLFQSKRRLTPEQITTLTGIASYVSHERPVTTIVEKEMKTAKSTNWNATTDGKASKRGASSRIDHSSIIKLDETDNCPICEKPVLKTDLQLHVSKCLEESEVAPHIFSQSDEPLKKISVNDGHQNREIGSSSNTWMTPSTRSPEIRHVKKNERGNTKKVTDSRCPICEKPIDRTKLESHVNQCMVSMGLDDVF